MDDLYLLSYLFLLTCFYIVFRFLFFYFYFFYKVCHGAMQNKDRIEDTDMKI